MLAASAGLSRLAGLGLGLGLNPPRRRCRLLVPAARRGRGFIPRGRKASQDPCCGLSHNFARSCSRKGLSSVLG